MKFARNTAIVLLVFLGVTALAGSIPMILHPHGNSTTLPLSTLSNSPFRTYLVPGILLFLANGLLAFSAFWVLIRRLPHYALLTAFQGGVLLVWLAVECWLLEAVIWLHYFYGVIALALIACSFAMRRESNSFKSGTPPGTRSA
jgi:hypothetical protein